MRAPAVGTYGNTGYQLTLEAITHPGPADPARLSRCSICWHGAAITGTGH